MSCAGPTVSVVLPLTPPAASVAVIVTCPCCLAVARPWLPLALLMSTVLTSLLFQVTALVWSFWLPSE